MRRRGIGSMPFAGELGDGCSGIRREVGDVCGSDSDLVGILDYLPSFLNGVSIAIFTTTQKLREHD